METSVAVVLIIATCIVAIMEIIFNRKIKITFDK